MAVALFHFVAPEGGFNKDLLVNRLVDDAVLS